jgi:hypothetical protein
MGMMKSCCAGCRAVITEAKAIGTAMVPFKDFESLVSRGQLPVRGHDLLRSCKSLAAVELDQVHDRLILPVAGQYEVTKKKMGAERTTQNKKHSSAQQSATSRTFRTPTTTLVAAAGLDQIDVVTLSHNNPRNRQLAPETT